MRRRQQPVLTAFGTAGVLFAACQVYDPSDLVGASAGGSAGVPSSGGASGSGGLEPGTGGALPAGGLGGDQNLAGDAGFEGGAAGEDGSGGAGGSSLAAAGGGANGTGASAGSMGAGRGGASASGGAGAGGSGKGGTAGVSGSAGAGGAGGAGKGGTAGASAGTAGASGAGGRAGSSGTSGGGAGGSAEVALTGTATADSYENTSGKMHPPEHANDGDLATRWCAANSNAGHYWTLDLGASHTLTRVEVVWEYPSQAEGLPYRYIVGVSDDGTTFTTVIDRGANTDTMSTQRSDFPSSTTGRYVRVTVTELPNGTTWASFWEAHVFGG